MTTIVHVVGARPQFVKAAPVSRALAGEGIHEILVHTGQHYDWEMSAAFFEGLNLPTPAFDLGVGSSSHGAQTGRMLEALEEVLVLKRPDAVLVHGDTNSTLAGALAAAKLHIPVAHVEAGLRSFNRRMPEEINRVVTDHLSALLFAPTECAVANLAAEGLSDGVVRTGDVMYDLALQMGEKIDAATDRVLREMDVARGRFALMTIHRPENTDDPVRWRAILDGAQKVGESLPVVWPVHPRARALIEGYSAAGVRLVNPQPYLNTQVLVRYARVVITDSGGLQKEAAFHGTPCVTYRDETEWVELVEAGVNILSPPDADSMVALAREARWPMGVSISELFGTGSSSVEIAVKLKQYLHI